MLLTGFKLEIFKSHCDAQAKGVHCFAHLDDDISEVLPYLNTIFGASVYIAEPPSLMLQVHGKLITLESRKIAVNALKDVEEAEKIVAWLQREINDGWEKRGEIEPSTEAVHRPVLLEILKRLPRTNCRQCGEATCMVFASRVVEGSLDQEDCPTIDSAGKAELKEYLSRFRFG